MKKTYKVTIETKEGATAPAPERVRTAVAGCEVHIGEDFAAVNVEEVIGNLVDSLVVTYRNPIFGIARWDAANAMWEFHDYFSTSQKARNAASRASKRCRAVGLEWDFVPLRFSHADHLWYRLTAAE